MGGKKIFFKKKFAWELEERKKRLLLHPLYGGRAQPGGEKRGGRPGRKKSLKKVGRGVGRKKKTITFAARFGRNGGKKMKTEGVPSGVAAIYRKFFDAMAPRER